MAGNRKIRVVHPEYGSFTAEGVKDKMEAVIRAAKSWGAQWSQVAKVATYEEVS